MDIKKLTQEVLLKNMTSEQQMAVLESVQASVKEAKAVQKQKIAENVELVLQALKRIEADMLQRINGTSKVVEDRVKTIKDGKDGKNGIDGKAGKDGKDGKNGTDGRNGKDGINGVSGERGQDGVGVQAAHIDFDGSLIIALTNGQELNVGEVVPMDVAEKIKVIGNGGGTSQYVLDALASLQTAIDGVSIPSQTGNAGKYLGTTGSALQWENFPDLTITDTFVVNTQAAMLALSAQKGDVAVRTDLNKTYILTSSPATTLGNWQELLTPTDLVTSVAGRTGNVTLASTDISGLGTIATQAANNVSITGGSITGITDLTVADGGTGASTASGARTNLGLVIGTDVLAPNGSAASLTSFPTFNQNTTGTASNVTGTVAIANGGTGQTTRQNAMDALAGAVTSGQYLRGNGTDVVMSAIQAADVPTLNQNTTGTAASTPKLLSTNFTIEESGGKLLFKYGATTIASMSSTGVITSVTNIVSNGTP